MDGTEVDNQSARDRGCLTQKCLFRQSRLRTHTSQADSAVAHLNLPVPALPSHTQWCLLYLTRHQPLYPSYLHVPQLLIAPYLQPNHWLSSHSTRDRGLGMSERPFFTASISSEQRISQTLPPHRLNPFLCSLEHFQGPGEQRGSHKNRRFSPSALLQHKRSVHRGTGRSRRSLLPERGAGLGAAGGGAASSTGVGKGSV